MSSSSQQQAKVKFCDAFNMVYGTDLSPDNEELFYKISPAPQKFPGLFTLSLCKSHSEAKRCLTMKSGCHKNSTKMRTFTVNTNTGAVWQKCWSKQCMRRENKGRIALAKPAESEDETESEDEDAVPEFMPITLPSSSSNKKRKRNNDEDEDEE